MSRQKRKAKKTATTTKKKGLKRRKKGTKEEEEEEEEEEKKKKKTTQTIQRHSSLSAIAAKLLLPFFSLSIMAWLRSAISKAAEVGGKNIAPNLSRTVRTVAQHAGQAVAGGAKLVQDRLVGRNLNSFKNAVKRLDEVAQNARGVERVQALARWLGALKEIGRDFKLLSTTEEANARREDAPVSPSHEDLPSPRRASTVFFYDFDGDGEPMNFREVFLRSHAIENIVTSMILEAPADEEIDLLLEIFGLCLAGGKELHNAIISSIQDLSKAFSNYSEEIMSKREDLLQYARDAVSGLKLNADVERLEAKIASLMQLIAEKQDATSMKEDVSSKMKEIIQLDVQLYDLLQRKRLQFSAGDTQAARAEKVELLKTFMESLKQASLQAEKLISENRIQKDGALKYRAAKSQEVNEVEKAVMAEVRMLEQKRVELEAQLKEVNASLAAATSRHINIQEEKEQFDEASTGVVAHLAVQEEKLTKSIKSNTIEAGVVGTWISFLEDTWQLRASCVHQRESESLDALNGLREQFLHTVVANLSYHQEELNLLVKQMKLLCDELKGMENGRTHISEAGTGEKDADGQKNVENYLEVEGQVVSILQSVEVLKEEVESFRNSGTSNDLEKRIMDAFDSIEQTRKEVEAMQRPNLDFHVSRAEISQASSKSNPSLQLTDPQESTGDEAIALQAFVDDAFSGEILEEEVLGKDTNEMQNLDTGLQEETAGWEFDELEEELKREGSL